MPVPRDPSVGVRRNILSFKRLFNGNRLVARGGFPNFAVVVLRRNNAGGSPASATEEDDGDGLEHDAQVLAQALAADVLEVVAHLGAHVLQRTVVVVVDLG